jgi:hypothetical protein
MELAEDLVHWGSSSIAASSHRVLLPAGEGWGGTVWRWCSTAVFEHSGVELSGTATRGRGFAAIPSFRITVLQFGEWAPISIQMRPTWISADRRGWTWTNLHRPSVFPQLVYLSFITWCQRCSSWSYDYSESVVNFSGKVQAAWSIAFNWWQLPGRRVKLASGAIMVGLSHILLTVSIMFQITSRRMHSHRCEINYWMRRTLTRRSWWNVHREERNSRHNLSIVGREDAERRMTWTVRGEII